MDDASTSSSSSSNGTKYDIFLNFRGEDTRYGFVSHLYAALCRKKIKTYMDDTSLERGHEISCSITQAIQESKLSVVVFSENYASSSWCLGELVQILECKERYKQIVTPVFYHVEPAHIRKQQGSYGDSFSVLEERFKDEMHKVKEWRVALTMAADLAGWHSSAFRSEAELLDKIVEDVIRKLDNMPRPSDDLNLKGLVGTKKQAEKIKSLLRINCNHDNVRIIGIWGMGGIGKTTLTNVVFNELSSRFEGRCFLANVREEWTKGRRHNLQKELFSKLLEEDNQYNVKSRLRDKKVLIVLDDVNDQEQLQYFIGDFRNFFCHGSRIIVTTRDMQMLRYIGAHESYRVEELNRDDALELFVLTAFDGNLPAVTVDLVKILERVINYAKGIPLALTVLSSHLRCKKQENWEGELDELEQAHSIDKIQNVLKVSYDGLHEKDRQIFLDIACFFKGAYRDCAEEFWNACGFSARTRVDNLIEKSLVTIKDANTLWMHDLVQKMGWEIMSSTKEPRKRSRLWIAQDIIRVVKNKSGSEEVEGMFLEPYKIGVVELSPEVFKEMRNLRFLKIYDWQDKLHFPQGLDYLPDELRYLEWYNCPLKSFPSNFMAQNLVELRMRCNQLEQLWTGVQNLGNLKYVDLSNSLHLTQIPDLSRAPKLEYVNLTLCEKLVQVPPLNFQTISTRTSEEHWPYKKSGKEPGTLILSNCPSLESLPNISGTVKYLHLDGTKFGELPTSISSLDNLILLDLHFCKYLENLPGSICKLESLEYLSLCSCTSLSKFPEELPSSIVEFDLSWTPIEQVPSSIKHVSNLQILDLQGCKRLEQVSASICSLRSLRHLNFYLCSKLEKLPEVLEPMERLETLDLRETRIRELPFSFKNLSSLRHLLFDSCKNSQFQPDSIISTNSLENICHTNCS